jgi:uroporphyrinogen decarboxylase
MSEKTERARRVLAGDLVEPVPYSVWTHFPGIDLDADRLADATIRFYRELDLDFVKSMANGMFSVQDFGCEVDFSAIPAGGVATATRLAIDAAADWERLAEPDIGGGALARELRSLGIVLASIGAEVPVLATVFSPLTTAWKLSGARLFDHLRSDPQRVRAGLDIITASTIAFAVRAVEMGCAGLYFASQASQRGVLGEREYAAFGVPWDLRVLDAVRGGSWFNVLHAHGDDIMFDLLKDYPVHGISWHVWETGPSIGEFVAARTGKTIVGGLRRNQITQGARGEIEKDIDESLRLSGGRRLFLAPGCVIRAPYDRETLLFLRRRAAGARGGTRQ